MGMKVLMTSELLEINNTEASENRERFFKERVFVMNLIGSPGSGKTTLLEKTLKVLAGKYSIGVIEGDICTAHDAERIASLGIPAVQLNTAGGCHLEACMLAGAIEELPGRRYDVLVVENVGNLVCPAEFDLGEDCKIAVLSVTEGDEKPEKYPLVFQEAGAVVITKTDLLPYTDFSVEAAERDIRLLNSEAPVFTLSSYTGEGFESWLAWLEAAVEKKTKRD